MDDGAMASGWRTRRQDMGRFRNRLEAEIFENGQPAAERNGIALMIKTRMEFKRAIACCADEFDADLIARQRIDLLDILERCFRIGLVAIAGREGAAPARDQRLFGSLGAERALQPVIPVAHRLDNALLETDEVG